MTKDFMIKLLMADRCTKNEALRYLDDNVSSCNCIIYEDLNEYIQSLKDCDCYDGQTIEGLMNNDYVDHSYITYEGKGYLLVYSN